MWGRVEAAILNKVAREDFTKKFTFEQRLEVGRGSNRVQSPKQASMYVCQYFLFAYLFNIYSPYGWGKTPPLTCNPDLISTSDLPSHISLWLDI